MIQRKLQDKGVKKGKFGTYFSVLFSALFFLNSFSATAQEVEASVDTAAIRIGEQIIYNISIESDPEDLVVFPEGQTFSPLEMVESFPVDTNSTGDLYRLIKEYSLTQFDSGSYTIPRQRVVINDQNFFTDSLLVEVSDVVVDTTKQKMFPIKPSVEVPSAFQVPVWLWWTLGILLVLAIFGYLWHLRKKKKEAAAQKLPPYEQALFELRQLDESQLLEKREIKEYYSQLSASVRRYLDEEVYDHAMESTTSELISYLEAEREQGKVKLENMTIARLKQILDRADLAKFANSRPDVLTAKEDRGSVENVINDTKASIPQPSEEDLLRDQKYRERKERKKKVRKIIFGILGVILLISAATAYIISTRGVAYFTDTFIGNDTKDLLEGEWILSEYGTPPVTITTPDVLVRDLTDTLGIASGRETFKYGSIESNLYIDLNTRPVSDDFELESALEEVYTYLEKRGARNILTKQEEFTTLNGLEGLRIFGTMDFEKQNGRLQQKEYEILNFGLGEAYQQIVVIYDEEDTYADEIAQRITASVELVKIQE